MSDADEAIVNGAIDLLGYWDTGVPPSDESLAALREALTDRHLFRATDATLATHQHIGPADEPPQSASDEHHP